jgi:hypothetical protein
MGKWYLDCVTAEGESVVLYQAQLRWGALAIRYASVLGGGTTLRAISEPSVDGDTVAWSAPRLGVEGTWRALAPARRETLFPGVEWRCVQPRAFPPRLRRPRSSTCPLSGHRSGSRSGPGSPTAWTSPCGRSASPASPERHRASSLRAVRSPPN